MTTEGTKALVQRAVEAFNRGDLAAVANLFTDDYVDHDPSRAALHSGPEGIRQAWGMMRAAFPDLEATIDDLVAEGDNVAVRGHISGTHGGELMGIPPTGKRVMISLIDINRIVDGRLAERWAVADMLGMLQQLDAMPAPEQAGRPEHDPRPHPRPHRDHPRSAEEPKTIVARFIAEVINRGNLAVSDELIAAEYVYRAPGMEVHGPEGLKGVVTELRSAFPDWHETTEDVLAEGDTVVFRVTGHGTHRGAFFTIPPTGKPVQMTGIDFVRLDGGQLVEHWAVFDQLGLLRQLGALPAPGQSRT